MDDKKKTKILIIEDNEIFRGMLSDKLKSVGYDTSFLASNSTKDEVMKEYPKLVIINIVSPVENGLKLIKEMSVDPKLSVIPVIAIAKKEGSVLIEKARKYNVKYTIDKVLFDSEETLEIINRCIRGEKISIEEQKSETTEKTSLQTLKKGAVLLIEDDVFVRELLSTKLQRVGFEVHDVGNAFIAGKAIEDGKPDIILLDLLLPDKSGFKFLLELKNNKEYSKIPVIVISNLSSKGDVDRALDLGAVDFLVKSNVTIEEIITKTEKYIKKSKIAPNLPESVMNEESGE